MKNFSSKAIGPVSVLAATLLLVACGGGSNSNNDSDDMTGEDGDLTTERRSYQVEVLNLTNLQPLSPVAVVLHQSGYQAWVDGETASTALELLAEGGDNSDLLTEASNHDAYLQSASGSGAVGPGATDVLTLEVDAEEDIFLSLITMLVNTNDAYSGLNGVDVSALQAGESLSFNAPVWDAGTEFNSEASGTIPGPADGGEGFSASREGDVDRVHFHPGVISNQDGLESSVLNADHRFDNPAARVIVSRVN